MIMRGVVAPLARPRWTVDGVTVVVCGGCRTASAGGRGTVHMAGHTGRGEAGLLRIDFSYIQYCVAESAQSETSEISSTEIPKYEGPLDLDTKTTVKGIVSGHKNFFILFFFVLK